jgi:hypothetical protein
MRLSEWRARAPSTSSVSAKVLAVLEPVLESLGAGRNPECWVHWGDDPGVRWTLLAPTPAGLVECNVRVSVPGEGPRAAAKLVRWSRVQIGDLAVESQGGHRFVSLQVEGLVLRGVDEEADRIAAFVRRLFDAADGRTGSEAGAAGGSGRGRRRQAASGAE